MTKKKQKKEPNRDRQAGRDAVKKPTEEAVRDLFPQEAVDEARRNSGDQD